MNYTEEQVSQLKDILVGTEQIIENVSCKVLDILPYTEDKGYVVIIDKVMDNPPIRVGWELGSFLSAIGFKLHFE